LGPHQGVVFPERRQPDIALLDQEIAVRNVDERLLPVTLGAGARAVAAVEKRKQTVEKT
jgi:hypothetical protein